MQDKELKKALLKQLIAEMDGVKDEDEVAIEEAIESPCEAMEAMEDESMLDEDEAFDLKEFLKPTVMDEEEDDMDIEEGDEEDGVIRIGISQALQGIKTPDKKIIKKTPPKISIKKR